VVSLRKSARSRHKCTAPPAVVAGAITDMDDLEQQYIALVERVRGYAMTDEALARILGEIEAAYRRERARKRGDLPQLDL
jgi:hypothetical protein